MSYLITVLICCVLNTTCMVYLHSNYHYIHSFTLISTNLLKYANDLIKYAQYINVLSRNRFLQDKLPWD